MISLSNALTGLSAADISQLFGTNSSSTMSSSVKLAASADGFTSTPSDPAKTIQAIVVQAQIEKAQTSTSSAGSKISAFVSAAYASQTVRLSDFMNATTGSVSEPVVNSYVNEPSDIGLAIGGAYAALSASGADGSTSGTTVFAAAERVGEGATDPWGGGMTVSALGEAASVVTSGSATSSASVKATFTSIAAYQQVVANGGSPVTLDASAYASQTGGSASLRSGTVTLSLPDTAQQIAYAVTAMNTAGPYTETIAPPNDQGIQAYGSRVSVTAADAFNVTIANGVASVTNGAKGAGLPEGLPSLANIQKAIDQLKISTPEGYASRTGLDPAAYEGSVILVKLPANSMYASGDNFVTFYTSNQFKPDADDKWALVMPQDTVTVTLSNTQTQS